MDAKKRISYRWFVICCKVLSLLRIPFEVRESYRRHITVYPTGARLLFWSKKKEDSPLTYKIYLLKGR